MARPGGPEVLPIGLREERETHRTKRRTLCNVAPPPSPGPFGDPRSRQTQLGIFETRVIALDHPEQIVGDDPRLSCRLVRCRAMPTIQVKAQVAIPLVYFLSERDER